MESKCWEILYGRGSLTWKRNGKYYLVMENKGPTYQQLLTTEETTDERRLMYAIKFTKDVAEMHSKKMIHTDLKLDAASYGDGDTIAILDTDGLLVKSDDEVISSQKITAVGYAPPEVRKWQNQLYFDSNLTHTSIKNHEADGAAEFSLSSDVYSLMQSIRMMYQTTNSAEENPHIRFWTHAPVLLQTLYVFVISQARENRPTAERIHAALVEIQKNPMQSWDDLCQKIDIGATGFQPQQSLEQAKKTSYSDYEKRQLERFFKHGSMPQIIKKALSRSFIFERGFSIKYIKGYIHGEIIKCRAECRTLKDILASITEKMQGKKSKEEKYQLLNAMVNQIQARIDSPSFNHDTYKEIAELIRMGLQFRTGTGRNLKKMTNSEMQMHSLLVSAGAQHRDEQITAEDINAKIKALNPSPTE